MYNKHLDSFINVAKTGSFAKAAELMHISRNALVQQINLLEDHIGFTLFIRSSKGATLTPEGKLFERKTKEIMRLSAETLSQCRAMQNKKQIRIGILHNIPLVLLTQICIEYNKLYPETEIIFVERTTEEYLTAFQNNEFDISAEYMSKLVLPDEEVLFAKLLTDWFDCAVPPNSPLTRKKSITLDDLKDHEICLFVSNMAQAEDNLRAYIKKTAPDLEIVDIESYSKSLPLECILKHKYLLHYHITAKEYLPLISRPLELEQECPIEMGLCYKPNASADVRSFINFAQTYCQKNF